MRLLSWFLSLLLLPRPAATRSCFPGCHCEVETFGLFDSFSLTKVDCSGVGPHVAPVPIPLDTSYLDLSSNRLEAVNESMLSGPGYTTLVSLDLSHNRIAGLSRGAFSRLRYLEALDLSHNSLEALPEDCFSSSPLSDVDLSHNKLRAISVDVFATKSHGKALSVDLSNNLLDAVTRSRDRSVPSIQSLDLSGNRLRAVPRLQGMPLRYLSLDGNPLGRIEEGDLAGLRDLTHLSLSGLRGFEDLAPGSFKDLAALQVLDLSNNPSLTSLGAAVLAGLDSLQELSLSGTGVAALPRTALERLPSIESIALGRGVRCLRSVRGGRYRRQPGSGAREVLSCHDGRGA
ncbi:TSK protein, partial [Rhinopomastus cyanomelas]|nr:TSK protein [Rhinopomastus cyanomelas]